MYVGAKKHRTPYTLICSGIGYSNVRIKRQSSMFQEYFSRTSWKVPSVLLDLLELTKK